MEEKTEKNKRSRGKFKPEMRNLSSEDVKRILLQKISEEEPWKKAKAGEDISGLLYYLAEGLRQIAIALLPIIPESAEKILDYGT